MSDPEDDVVFGTHEEQGPGPSRRLMQPQIPAPLHSTATMASQLMRDAQMRRFHMGLPSERTPRPGILGHRASSTSTNPIPPRGTLPLRANIPATITQPPQQNPRPSAAATTPSQASAISPVQLSSIRSGMGQRFPQVPSSLNAYLSRGLMGNRQPQPSGLSAPPSIPQNLRPVQSSGTQITASGLLQNPTSSHGSQILRAPNFHPNLPMAQELMDDLIRQAHANVRDTIPSPPTSLKRQGSSTGPPAKRQAPNALRTIPYPKDIIWDSENDCDFMCSLCFDPFKEPHITQCGHTFCLSCIERVLLHRPKCPNCAVEIKRKHVVPNRAIHQLMRKQMSTAKVINAEVHISAGIAAENGSAFEDLDVHSFLQKKYNDLTLEEVEVLLCMLNRKKEVLYTGSEECRLSLLRDFLTHLRRLKEADLDKILEDISHIDSDLASFPPEKKALGEINGEVDDDKSIESRKTPPMEPVGDQPGKSARITPFNVPGRPPVNDIHFNATDQEFVHSQPSIAKRKLKVHSHLDSLSSMYLKGWRPPKEGLAEAEEEVGGVKTKPRKHLQDFTDALVRISRFSSFKVLATLTYPPEVVSNTNIVSTIEFDKDKDFFAIAGVAKKIRLFEYGSVIASAVKIQASSGEITCNSKISCVSYSNFYKNKLASSDYDGRVNIYDTSTCETVSTFNEHEKRVWSVDFCDADPRFLVSGSDDCKVKIWTLNQQNSETTLHASANVCCVKFVPGSSYNIAFGSADHCIHYYDLRQTKTPLRTYEGHKKAVSYVKFASNTELISASTDSNLKLWDLNGRDCVRSYVGHVNDKNFVGLTTDGNYVACGSENNSVYVYYKDLPYPLLTYQFENYRSMIHPARQEDVTCEFVSAVAWRTGSPVIVAANSQGIIKVLELI